MKRTLGIDEAGRGPVLGPMVMAAVCLETKAARKLSRAGLTDSKAFGAGDKARQTRQELAALVRESAAFAKVVVIDVTEIDRRVQRSELNVLEQEVARELIDCAPACERIVADGKRLFSCLCAEYGHLEALNKAESKHASGAAASVLAKHRRDEIFERIASRYRGEFGEVRGGGYGNKPTQEFLRAYAQRFGTLPPEARRSWPYPYLADILGDGYDPFTDCPGDRAGQLALL